MAKAPGTVDEYIKAQTPGTIALLKKVRTAIKNAAPGAEEKISYKIPIYILNGHLVAFFAAKNHSSFVTMSSNVIKNLNKEIKPFKVSGTTIHFTADNPLPDALVKKIVKARMKENEQGKKNRIV